jgi:bifunctional DNase/RNase
MRWDANAAATIRTQLRVRFLSFPPERAGFLRDPEKFLSWTAATHLKLEHLAARAYRALMSKPVVPVEIRTVLPFNAGRAVFIGNDEKVFVIYVDESVGAAITMFINDTPKERPLTHDLIGHLMAALGAKVERVIINDLKSETYFARLIVSAENELFEKKIVELDGRPSDCIALAIQQKAPIYVSKDVWDEVEDRSDVLRQIEENEQGGGASEET